MSATLRPGAEPRTSPHEVEQEVRYADTEGGTPRVAAHVERELPPGGVPAYLAARKTGARSFALWADPYRQRRIATVVTTAASGGVASYQVLGEQGEIIGTLTRERALSGSGLRTRWTVGGGGDGARGPRRIIWRTGKETPLEFRSGDDEVRVHVDWVDWRLAAAVLLLVRSFGHSCWDTVNQ
ncbi:hypothetical protein AB0P36_22380 [Streptomyces flavidovirens]|uniref:hypothetical protein n=1 Tax=Streptomyces flavidovirens TaxID=67298 RepID=UPI00341D3DD1